MSEDLRHFVIIAVYDPVQQRSKVFRQVCLLFGSRASVNGFIRCWRCIQWLASTCLLTPTTCYYDDFIIASSKQLDANTDRTCAWVCFSICLGASMTGPKADAFSQKVHALGVCRSLCVRPWSRACGQRRKARKGDLDNLLSQALKAWALQHKEAMQLRGRLAFAEAQVLGKAGQYALKVLSNHIFQSPFCANLEPDLVSSLKFMRTGLEEGALRTISKLLDACWYVFTDASFSCDFEGGLGGDPVSPRSSVCSWFSLMLSKSDVLPLLPNDAATGHRHR